jgi:hypothetical protein
MSDAIITVENLSKKYLVGHKSEIRSRSNYIALRDVVGSEIGNVVRKTIDVIRGRQVLYRDEIEEFWALSDVSFEVKQGEVWASSGGTAQEHVAQDPKPHYRPDPWAGGAARPRRQPARSGHWVSP